METQEKKKSLKELEQAILNDKTIKSEYAQASLVILRNIFTNN